jgi:thymidylate synthase
MTKQYLDAARTILQTGTRKPNRTGVDTISTFAVPMRFDLRDGFPLLTTKKMSWWNIVAENLWFLSGEPHIGFLKKHKVRFWDDWADKDGNVPSAYGNFWRHFPVHVERLEPHMGIPPGEPPPRMVAHPEHNDQIAWVVDQLRTNPMSRRLVVSAWAPGNAQTSKLPPCHVMWCLNTQNLHTIKTSVRGPGDITGWQPGDPTVQEYGHIVEDQHLCLHLTQRSCDMFLGVPYNIAGYAFILSILAHLSGLEPGIFSHMLVDAHFYTCKPDGSMASGGTHGEDDDEALDHIPMIKEQLLRTPRKLPKLTISDTIKELDDIKKLLEAPKDEIMDIFKLEDYNPYSAIKAKVAV